MSSSTTSARSLIESLTDLSSLPQSQQIDRLSSALHCVISSQHLAQHLLMPIPSQQKSDSTATNGGKRSSLLTQLLRSYRSILTSNSTPTPSTPTVSTTPSSTPTPPTSPLSSQETIKDLLLQLCKCVLPYTSNADVLHEILKMIEGIGGVKEKKKKESNTTITNGVLAGAATPGATSTSTPSSSSSSSFRWPFGLCGMLIDACASSPSIPYLLFDCDSTLPSTLTIPSLSPQIWPPGVAMPTALGSQASAISSPSSLSADTSIGYTYSMWVYMEPVVDTRDFDAASPTAPQTKVTAPPSSGTNSKRSSGRSPKKTAASSVAAAASPSRFVLLHLTSEDGKTGVSLTYLADSGTLILRTGIAAATSTTAAPAPTTSGGGGFFRFGSLTSSLTATSSSTASASTTPSTYEFTNVGLIPHRWTHLVVTHERGSVAPAVVIPPAKSSTSSSSQPAEPPQPPKASLYIDGSLCANATVAYLTRPTTNFAQGYKAWLGTGMLSSSGESSSNPSSPSAPNDISSSGLRWRWRIASTCLLCVSLSDSRVRALFDLGPRVSAATPAQVLGEKEKEVSTIIPSRGENSRIPLIDVVAGCYALPSACAEAMDEVAGNIVRQRRRDGFQQIGTVAIHQPLALQVRYGGATSTHASMSTPTMTSMNSSQSHAVSALFSPSSLHEHLLAPSLTSEHEMISANDTTRFEQESMKLNDVIEQEDVIWMIHARDTKRMKGRDGEIVYKLVNTGSSLTSSSSTSSSSSFASLSSTVHFIHPIPPQDHLGSIGGMRRVLVLLEQAVRMQAGSSTSNTSTTSTSRESFTDECNPTTSIRQALTLLIMCLRRHPKNFRDMHAIDGYRLVGYFMRTASGKKWRVKISQAQKQAAVAAAAAVASYNNSTSSSSLLASPSTFPASPGTLAAYSASVSPPTPPARVLLPPALMTPMTPALLMETPSVVSSPQMTRSVSSVSSASSAHVLLPVIYRPLIDLHIIDLMLSLVGLNERGMSGYVANLLALEYLLLDYRFFEYSSSEVQLYILQCLINSCVGNPDRQANIMALREAKFIPWILLVMNQTKLFESTTAKEGLGIQTGKTQQQSQRTGATTGRLSTITSPTHSQHEQTLLGLILTLLRVLLMSELIDSELHLLANFTLTRCTKYSMIRSLTSSPAVPQNVRMLNPQGSPTPEPMTANMHHTSGASLSAQTPSAATSMMNNSISSLILTALTTKRIQKHCIELLLDVLMKISTPSPLAGPPSNNPPNVLSRAMSIYTNSIDFAWCFGVLKGEHPPCSINSEIEAAQSDPNTSLSVPSSPASTALDIESGILTLKIMMILLESPQLLQEFRSSSIENSQHANGSSSNLNGASSSASLPVDPTQSLHRIISFASLSNLLLPYATCSRIYPILLCILFGKSVHDYSALPQELNMDTVEEIYRVLVKPTGAHKGVSTNIVLIVPEIVDILIDLLNRCLVLTLRDQTDLLSSNPTSFFAASLAVSSFLPPPTPHTRVYNDIYDTGILTRPPKTPQQQKQQGKKSKFGIDPTKWNVDREDRLEPLDRGRDIRAMIRDANPNLVTPPQAMHDPPQMSQNVSRGMNGQTNNRPNPLMTSTPISANGEIFNFSSTKSANGGSTAVTLATISPLTSLLNGLILFFMRLLYASEDFSRVVSRSTFLKPFVQAVFTSAQLNPIVTARDGGVQQAAQQQQPSTATQQTPQNATTATASTPHSQSQPSTANSQRPTSATMKSSAARFSHVPVPPSTTSHAKLAQQQQQQNPQQQQQQQRDMTPTPTPTIVKHISFEEMSIDPSAGPRTLIDHPANSIFSPSSQAVASSPLFSPDSTATGSLVRFASEQSNPLGSPVSVTATSSPPMRSMQHMQQMAPLPPSLLFSPTSGLGGVSQSSSPPVPHMFNRPTLDSLVSPANSSVAAESPMTLMYANAAAAASANGGMNMHHLASPQYMAYQHSQLSHLTAPASPPTSPSRKGAASASLDPAFQLTLDTPSTPRIALQQAHFMDAAASQAVLAANSTPINSNTTNNGGMSSPPILSSFTFTPTRRSNNNNNEQHDLLSTPTQAMNQQYPSASPEVLRISHAIEPSTEPPSVGEAVMPAESVSPEAPSANGATTTASSTATTTATTSSSATIRLPIFRHSTSQLLLRFLRQIVMYHLTYKKDGWMILEKVLDAYPVVGRGGSGKSDVNATAGQSSNTQQQHAVATQCFDEYRKNEDLIKGYQSTILNILLIRIQEKLDVPPASGASTSSLLLMPLPITASQSTTSSSTSATTAPSSQQHQPTKLLRNLSHVVEFIFFKIQSGMFVAQNWTAKELLTMGSDGNGDNSHNDTRTNTAVSSTNSGSVSSTIGLMLLIVNILTHEGLRQATDELNAQCTVIQAKYLTGSGTGGQSGGGLSGTSGSNNNTTTSSSSSSTHKRKPSSYNNAYSVSPAMTSALTQLMSQDINKLLRTFYDILLNTILHLYDQFTLKELSQQDMIYVNTYIYAYRKLVLGDYITCAHLSNYISGFNTLGGGWTNSTALQQAANGQNGSSTTTAINYSMNFTSRSFIACLMYHLYNFQLNVVSNSGSSVSSGNTATDEANQQQQSLAINTIDSPPSATSVTPTSSSTTSSSSILTDLKYSALSLLIALIRARPHCLSDLMRASIASDDSTVAATPIRRSSGAPLPTTGSGIAPADNPIIMYDLYNNGFDVLLGGFHTLLAQNQRTSNMAASNRSVTPIQSPTRGVQGGNNGGTSQNSSTINHSEIEGFFSWLTIQHDIILSVFSRTLLPEWRSYCKFLNSFLYASNENLMMRLMKVYERDQENMQIDTEERGMLHTSLDSFLSSSSTLDSTRYLRRIQSFYEHHLNIKRIWKEKKDELTKRTYAMYSNSRRLYKQMPKRNEWRKVEEKKMKMQLKVNDTLVSTNDKRSSTSNPASGTTSANASAPSTSSDDDDSDVDGSTDPAELLISPSELVYKQQWKLDHSLECISRTRPRLARPVLQHPDLPVFNYPYKREAEEGSGAGGHAQQQQLQVKPQVVRDTRVSIAKPTAQKGDNDETDEQHHVVRIHERENKITQIKIEVDLSSKDVHDDTVQGHGAEADSKSKHLADALIDEDLASRLHHRRGSSSQIALVLEVSPTPVAHKVLESTRRRSITQDMGQEILNNLHNVTTNTIDKTDVASAIPTTINKDHVNQLVSPKPSHIHRSSEFLVVPASNLDLIHDVIADGVLPMEDTAAAQSKHIPESSDRPTAAAARRMTITPLHSSRKSPTGAFFTTATSRASLPPRTSPKITPNASPGGTPVTALTSPPPMLFPQTAFRRGKSMTSSSATSSPLPLVENETSGAAAATTIGAAPSTRKANGSRPSSRHASRPSSVDTTLQTLQVDIPTTQPSTTVNSPNSTAPVSQATSPPLTTTQAQQNQQQQQQQQSSEAAPAPALTPNTSGSNSQPATPQTGLSTLHSGLNSPHVEGSDEDQNPFESNTYLSSLLTEESTWFLYEERLRYLLDEYSSGSINYHYNCLRIQGLEEISAIVLLCQNALFIVDQYQINPDGSIVRLSENQEEETTRGGIGNNKKKDALHVASPSLPSNSDDSSTRITTHRSWSYSDIISVHKRRYLLRPAALEIFFSDRTNYFLVVNIKQRELIYKNLMQLCTNITDGTAGPIGGLGTNAGGSSNSGSNSHSNSSVNIHASIELPSSSNSFQRYNTSDAFVIPPLPSSGNSSARDRSEAGGSNSTGISPQLNASPYSHPSSGNLPMNINMVMGLGLGLQPEPPVPVTLPSSSVARLPMNFSSIFFANHTLTTENTINMLSSIIQATLEQFTQEWIHGFLSNYDYLSILNSFSGRSFNDLTQYPVFPWILSDYDSEELDLYSYKTYRDLSKPCGALDEIRAKMHQQKYKETEMLWKEEERESKNAEKTGFGGRMRNIDQQSYLAPGVNRAYNYGTHYSSAAVVMYYLLRLEPYTQYFLSFQSGRFDRPDRLFSSIKQTFLTASKIPSGDVKELIPEFFYLPSMLTNGNELEFGRRQDGRFVNNVLLPPWAKGSPREFIRLHRLALESDYVSSQLHLWIDLIFGEKQQGESAIRALNVFHYVTYAGNVDIDKIDDLMLRRALVEQVKSFGQTPALLFSKPHPPRIVASRIGRLVKEPNILQPTDQKQLPHSISQICCLDRTSLVSGVVSTIAYGGNGSGVTADRIFLTKPGEILSIPSLQSISSFLPYTDLINIPPSISTRNVRLSKAYRQSAMFNKMSLLQYGCNDGTLRTGLVDLGGSEGEKKEKMLNTVGGLDTAVSVSVPNVSSTQSSSPQSPQSFPHIRTLKAYLNMHDGAVRVACVPVEGDDGMLVTGGEDGLICVWQRSPMDGGSNANATSSSSSNPTVPLITSTSDETYSLISELTGHRGAISSLFCSRSYSLLISGSEDGSVVLWDITRFHSVRTLRYTPRDSCITHITMNLANGDIAYTADNPVAMCMTDVNGVLLARYPDPRAFEQTAGIGDVPEQLMRDVPMDQVTSITAAHTYGYHDSSAASGTSSSSSSSSSARSDTSSLILTGHASGVIRVWHMRWLSWKELFDFYEPKKSVEAQFLERFASSAPPASIGGNGAGSRTVSAAPLSSTASMDYNLGAPQLARAQSSSLLPSTAWVHGQAVAEEEEEEQDIIVRDEDGGEGEEHDDIVNTDHFSHHPLTTHYEPSSARSVADDDSSRNYLSVEGGGSTIEHHDLFSPSIGDISSSPPASIVSTSYDQEVRNVNSSTASAPPPSTTSYDDLSGTTLSASLLASQSAARHLSSQVFGSPGEEQLADDYFASGDLQRAMRRKKSSSNSLIVAPGTLGLTAQPPRVMRQWHFVCVGELLGHQVPVTALTLTRDTGALYSGDANGNIVHFTPANDATSERLERMPCQCKASRNKNRLKLYHSLATGITSSSLIPPPQRVICPYRGCPYIGCDFCHLDHVRKSHCGEELSNVTSALPDSSLPFSARSNQYMTL